MAEGSDDPQVLAAMLESLRAELAVVNARLLQALEDLRVERSRHEAEVARRVAAQAVADGHRERADLADGVTASLRASIERVQERNGSAASELATALAACQRAAAADRAAKVAEVQAAAARDKGEALAAAAAAAEARLQAEASRAALAETQLAAELASTQRAEKQLKDAAAEVDALKAALDKQAADGAAKEAELVKHAAEAAASAAAAGAKAAEELARVTREAGETKTRMEAAHVQLDSQLREEQGRCKEAEGTIKGLALSNSSNSSKLDAAQQKLEAAAARERDLALQLGRLQADKEHEVKELGRVEERCAGLRQRVTELETQLRERDGRVGALEGDLREARGAQALAQHQGAPLAQQQQLYRVQQLQSDLHAEQQRVEELQRLLQAARGAEEALRADLAAAHAAHRGCAAVLAAAAAAGASGGSNAAAGAPSASTGTSGLSIRSSSCSGEPEVEAEVPLSPSLAVRDAQGALQLLASGAPPCADLQGALDVLLASLPPVFKLRSLDFPLQLARSFVKCSLLHLGLESGNSLDTMQQRCDQLRKEAALQAAASRLSPHVARVLGWLQHGAPPPAQPAGLPQASPPFKPWVEGLVMEPCGIAPGLLAAARSASSSSSGSSAAAGRPIADLGRLLDEYAVPLRARLGLAVHVAHGLAACAQLRLRHRDVKPENVLLFEGALPAAGKAPPAMPPAPSAVMLEGCQVVAKLGDFGSASQIAPGRGGTLGAAAATDFTLEYAAPEYLLQHLAREEEVEAEGKAPVQRKVPRSASLSELQAAVRLDYDSEALPRHVMVYPSVDVYAFGVLLWELVARGGGEPGCGSSGGGGGGDFRQSAKHWWVARLCEKSAGRQEIREPLVAKALLDGVRLPSLRERLAALRVPQALAERYQALVDECCALLPLQRPAIGVVLERLEALLAELGMAV